MAIRLLIAALIVTASTGARAEEACVKYHRCIPLDRFACTDTVSSFVHRICYAEPKRYLVIKLKGTYYHYCEVPPEVVTAFLAAPSKGRYYNQNIKSSAVNRAYDCRDHLVPVLDGRDSTRIALRSIRATASAIAGESRHRSGEGNSHLNKEEWVRGTPQGEGTATRTALAA